MRTAIFAVLLFVGGLAYRATFLGQGFNASDEAFLPALALRVLKGQVIYRDFNYASPPLTVYKEAGVAALLGADYGFLASRWVFAVEVSAGTVLAFLIVSRFFNPTVAFLATLPAIFFTTILYAYSNFNFDSQVLFLAGFTILVWDRERERWPLALAAGALCGMAFLAKPTYLAMGVGVAGLGLLRPLFGGPRRWPFYAGGFLLALGAVFATIALLGLWDEFRHQAFGQLLQARPVGLRQLLFQDWPRYLRPPQWAAVPAVATALLLGVASLRSQLVWPALALLAAVLAATVPPALASSTAGIPTIGQLNLLVGALGLVLGINVVASLVTVAARVPALASRPWAERVRADVFPPMVPVVAAVLEYIHGVDLSSMRFAYVGTFLGVPVALCFLHAMWRMAGAQSAVAVAVPAVVGVFIAVAGMVVTHGSPYLDGPRDQMTVTLSAPRLSGIATLPGNAQHIDALVEAIDGRTRPGDRVFVFPDGQAYYVVTGRVNPTHIDWYDVLATTPAMAEDARARLQANPPEWIFVQRYNEADIRHSRQLDFERQRAWRPIFDLIQSDYELVGSADGVDVYHLK